MDHLSHWRHAAATVGDCATVAGNFTAASSAYERRIFVRPRSYS